MAVITIKDKDGNLIDIPALQGEKGDKGDPGNDAAATDVQINGTSIVENGVANIPHNYVENDYFYGIKSPSTYTVAAHWTNIIVDEKGYLTTRTSNNEQIDNREYTSKPSVLRTDKIDYAVKAAMCDGKGEVWTSEEKASARDRMGIDTYELIMDITTEEDGVASINIKLLKDYKALKFYLIVPQVSATNAIGVEHKLNNIGFVSKGAVSTEMTKYIFIECNYFDGLGILSYSKHGINDITMSNELTLYKNWSEPIKGNVLLNFASGFPIGTQIKVWGDK